MRLMIDRNDEPRDDESRGSFVGQNRACSVGEFFKDKRRSDGLVLLVIACLFTIGWFRSVAVRDEFVLECRDGDETYLIRSHHQAIRYVYQVWSRNSGLREEILLSVPYFAIVLQIGRAHV